MKRCEWALAVVVLLELAVIGKIVSSPTAPDPPVMNLRGVDPRTAAELHEILAAHADEPSDWIELGKVYLGLGAFPEAEACYRRAVELNPGSAEAVYGWGLCLEPLGRNHEAVEQFSRALDLGHHRDRCWYRTGRNYLRLERVADAERAFRQASGQPASRYELAKILVRDSRAAEAIPLLDELIDAYPTAAEPYLLRSRAAAAVGDMQSAAAYRESWEWGFVLLESDPAELRQNLAQPIGLERAFRTGAQLVSSGQLRTGIATLESALEYEWRRSAVYKIAEAYMDLSDPLAARRWLEEHLEREGPVPDVLVRLGDAWFAAGDPDQAGQLWERAVAMRPGGDVHNRLEQYYQSTNPEKARAHRAGALHAAGIEAYWIREFPKADSLFRQALQLDNARAITWFYLGETLRQLSRMDEATAVYERCLAIQPHHGRAAAALVQARMSIEGVPATGRPILGIEQTVDENQ